MLRGRVHTASYIHLKTLIPTFYLTDLTFSGMLSHLVDPTMTHLLK